MMIIENKNIDQYVSELSDVELDYLINYAQDEKKKRATDKYTSRQSLEYKNEEVKEEVKKDINREIFSAAWQKAKNVKKKIIEIRRYFKCSDKVLLRADGNCFYKSRTDKNLLAKIYANLLDYERKAFNIEFDPDISEELKNSYLEIIIEVNSLIDEFEEYLDYVQENAKTYANKKLNKDTIKELDGYNSMLVMANSGIQILDKGYDIQAIKSCKKSYRKIQKYFNK